MFNSTNQYIVYIAVLFSMFFIVLAVWYVNKLFLAENKDLLVRFILLVFGALVAVFVVDKVVAFGMPLLSVQQNENLFDLIKTLTLMIFSYYFGTQKHQEDKND
jgi:surface polysaccharide O-acyltransferase-like enzyme